MIAFWSNSFAAPAQAHGKDDAALTQRYPRTFPHGTFGPLVVREDHNISATNFFGEGRDS